MCRPQLRMCSSAKRILNVLETILARKIGAMWEWASANTCHFQTRFVRTEMRVQQMTFVRVPVNASVQSRLFVMTTVLAPKTHVTSCLAARSNRQMRFVRTVMFAQRMILVLWARASERRSFATTVLIARKTVVTKTRVARR